MLFGVYMVLWRTKLMPRAMSEMIVWKIPTGVVRGLGVIIAVSGALILFGVI